MLSSKIYYNDKTNIHTSSKRYGHPMILIYTLRQNVIINFIIMDKISKTL